jgi:hypothetical protein
MRRSNIVSRPQSSFWFVKEQWLLLYAAPAVTLRTSACSLPKRHLYVFVIRRNVKSSVVWDITPCSPLKVNQGLFGLFIDPENGGDTFLRNLSWLSADHMALCPKRNLYESGSKLLPTCFMLVPCLAYSSTLKKEAVYSFETSVNFHRTTRRCMS